MAELNLRAHTPEETAGRALLTSAMTRRLYSREASLLDAIEADLRKTRQSTALRIQYETLRNLVSTTSMCLVGQGDSFRIYSKPLGEHAYRATEDDLLILSLIDKHAPTSITGGEARAIRDTLLVKLRDGHYLGQISRRIVAITTTLYWDSETGTLITGAPPADAPRCFFKLFDMRAGDALPSFTFDQIEEAFSEPSPAGSLQPTKFLSTYYSFLAELRALPDHKFPKDDAEALTRPKELSFIEEWADGHPGLYWDLIKIPATVFMANKPQAAYFLTGSGANGKSTYVSLLHTLVGTNNTSRVRVSKVGDWHFSSRFQFILLNAPEDEKPGFTDYADMFKPIASHDQFDMPVMYSQSHVTVNPDFICVFPMNQKPDWQGAEDSAALARRTLDFPFTGNFAEKRQLYHNFEKERFTLPTLRTLLAYALALATFYTEQGRTVDWSKTIDGTTEQVLQKNDNLKLYRRLFEKYFDTVQKPDLLYTDYVNYCECNSYNPSSMSAFEMEFDDWFSPEFYGKSPTKYVDSRGVTHSVRFYRKQLVPGAFKMFEYYPLKKMHLTNKSYPGADDIMGLHAAKLSIVHILEEMTALKLREFKKESHE